MTRNRISQQSRTTISQKKSKNNKKEEYKASEEILNSSLENNSGYTVSFDGDGQSVSSHRMDRRSTNIGKFTIILQQAEEELQ